MKAIERTRLCLLYVCTNSPLYSREKESKHPIQPTSVLLSTPDILELPYFALITLSFPVNLNYHLQVTKILTFCFLSHKQKNIYFVLKSLFRRKNKIKPHCRE